MKNKDELKRMIMLCVSAAAVVVFAIIFGFVWYRCYASNKTIIEVPFWRRGNYVVIGLYMLMLTLFFKLFGGFDVGYRRAYEVAFAQVFALFCANSITYLQLCLIGHWKFLENVEPMLYMTGVEILLACIYAVVIRRLYVALHPPRNMVLIYGDVNPQNMINKLGTRRDKIALCDMISYQEDMDLIQEKILKYRCALLTDIPDETRNALIKFCFAQDIRCYFVPKLSDVMVKSAHDIHLFDTSLLVMRNRNLTVEQRLAKRFIDIVVSSIGLIVASPFMLVIALCVKLYDRGPVFFTQQRLTQNGKLFKIYKFRSMRVQPSEAHYQMTRRNDDRITPVGKVIRNLHFDELPQLLNVLKGDMSIVGPRPECPQVAREYGELIPEFDFRLKVKAGLTGYAQVYGKYNTTPFDKLNMDLNYIENYSLLLDLKLMLMTVKILFQKEKTEGVEAWQTTAATEEKTDVRN